MKMIRSYHFRSLLVMTLLISACGVLSNAGVNDPFTGNPLEPLVPIPMPEPKDDQQAFHATQYCAPDGNGNFNAEVTASNGEAEDFVWGQGGACIFRPIREVWAVAHNQALMKWNSVTSITANLLPNPSEGVSHLYEIEYYVDAFIDVKWIKNWFHSVRTGTLSAPTQILINYKRISGTRFIPYWEGSVLLHQVTPDITAITMRDQIRASRTDSEDSEGSVRTVINKLRTGSPNWSAIGSLLL